MPLTSKMFKSGDILLPNHSRKLPKKQNLHSTIKEFITIKIASKSIKYRLEMSVSK